MAKVSEMLGGKYLKQGDVEEDTLVTIEGVKKANVAKEGDAPDYKWLIKFAEFAKPLVLNSTNIKRLEKAHGGETDSWSGKSMVLYVDPDVEFGGEIVGGLRLRAAKKAAVKPGKNIVDDAEDDLDSIPF